jgi:xylulokinase
MKREPVLIGIDIGTTNLKVVAYDVAGNPVASSHVCTPTCYPRPGWAHYDPDELWAHLTSILRQVTAALLAQRERYDIAGLAITGMAEAGIPVDQEGQWVYPAISWFDNRTQEQMEWWQAEVGQDSLYPITGLPLRFIWGLNKIMWLQAHEPAAYQRFSRWLHTEDYIAFRLSGVQGTNYSLASRTMALDLRTLTWSEDVLKRAGVRIDLFPPLGRSGEVVGRVTAEAGQATGLPAGTPVVSGGHDHICGALAAGAIRTGDLLDSMGTSESLLLPLDSPMLRAEVGQAGYAQGAHVVPGRYYIMGGLYTSGACVDWLRALLMPGGEQSYAELLALAAEAPVGSGGVFFVPHLRGATLPSDDPDARGTFIGLSTDTSRASLARAVLEGLAYEAFQSASAMTEVVGLPIERDFLIGGGTRNDLLLEIKATLANRTLQVVETEEATTLGAALLAGMGVGLYSDAADAQRHLRSDRRAVQPNAVLAAVYADRYRSVYVHIFESLRELHHIISQRFRAKGT